METLYLILLLVLVILLISLITPRTLVLKKIVLDPNNTSGNIVIIVARRSGFFSWLLTHLFKISPETSLVATEKDIRFKIKSISTEENVLITLRNGISHIYCKYHKPFWLLVLATIVLFAGIIGGIKEGTFIIVLGLIIIAVILFLIYFFNKSIAIVIETKGGTDYEIKFSSSFIEGQDVNINKVQEIITIIQNQIIKEQK